MRSSTGGAIAIPVRRSAWETNSVSRVVFAAGGSNETWPLLSIRRL
jgi:hypothetical protein